MERRLIYYDNPILRKKCLEVEDINNSSMQKLLQDLIDTVKVHDGAGLAAPQIGETFRVFLINKYNENYESTGYQFFINPVLSNPSKEKETMTEGCLSVPGIFPKVQRPVSITIEALDEKGNSFKETFHGYRARQVMHENDHLNGKLHIDRLTAKDRRKAEPILRQIKQKYAR